MLSPRILQPRRYCRAKDAAKAQEVFDQLRAQSIRQINFKIWLWPTPRFKAGHTKEDVKEHIKEGVNSDMKDYFEE